MRGMKNLGGNFVFLLLCFWPVYPARAQVVPDSRQGLSSEAILEQLADEAATESADATDSAEAATPSGIVEKQVEEKPDLTQPTQEVKGKLERVLEANPVGPLSWNNFLQVAVVRAVKNGVPANTVVLVLLFPLIVAIVAAARHLIGIRGVGILTPALLSVAFLATGITSGVLLFLIILAVATIARQLLKRLKLQYLPRMALLLWFVSAGVFATLLLASFYDFGNLVTVGIFPILILMLLAETFIDIQAGRSASEARDIILQTFLLAMLSSLLLAWDMVQRVVLLNPEIVFLGVAVFDLFVGKYTGLRLSEYKMFKPAIRDDEEE
jgi:hypothetical protein